MQKPQPGIDLLKALVWAGLVAFGFFFWLVIIPAVAGALRALELFSVPGAF